MEKYLLLIDEVVGHPKSAVTTLCSKFEKHSILHISSEQQLSKIKTKPIFSEKYLVIFDSLYALKQALQSVKFEYMFPVYAFQKREYDEILSFLNEKKVRYVVLKNEFTKEDAQNFVASLAKEGLSDKIINQILSKTGYYPKRIITAAALLDTYGYTEKNIKELLDFSVYISSFDIVSCLLGLQITKKKYNDILSYVSTYRSAYRYIKEELIIELDTLISVFFDILNSVPEQSESIREYISSKDNLTYYKYYQIDELIGKVSIVDLLTLKRYIADSDILSFIYLLGGRQV